MKCLFNLLQSPLALMHFGEEQRRREGGKPSLPRNFTTNSSPPQATTAHSLTSAAARHTETHRKKRSIFSHSTAQHGATDCTSGVHQAKDGKPLEAGQWRWMEGESFACRSPSPGQRGTVASRHGSAEARRPHSDVRGAG